MATQPDHRPSLTARKVRYVTDVSRIPGVPETELDWLREVAKKYVFRANDYYLELIDWNDPADPIRQLIIPRPEELSDWGQLDASNEKSVTVSPGVQHKYPDTVLLLTTETCGAYCRYCFRKRLFMNDNDEVKHDITPGIEYVAQHPEVTNVLLTGGDPLILSTRKLRNIISRLRAIEHVKIIRIGSKIPAFNPYRLLQDEELQDLLREFSTAEKRIYLMAHFDHPRELTPAAAAGIAKFIECGVICVNQCPLIKGVNDDPEVLSELYRKLSWIGCSPYYLFQGRPTAGNEPYEVPIVQGYGIFEQALLRGSGLARRPRYAMSHATGKIEVCGIDERYMYMRYHRAKNPVNRGRFMVFHRDDEAFWFDQLRPADESFVPCEVSFTAARRNAKRNGKRHGHSLRRHRPTDQDQPIFERGRH